MQDYTITGEQLQAFRQRLVWEEKSPATIEKYLLERPLFPASGGFKVRPAIEDFTAAAQLRSIQDAEQGGFPGAGRADDREKLAVAQGEADIPQHLAGTLKLFADMDRLQHEIPPEDGHASIDFKSAWAARSPS